MNLPQSNNDITYFAVTNFRNKEVKFGIKRDDRRRHMYLIGKTGMGKTTLLENMVINDIYSGNGLCYIDPHGDSVETFLNYIPPSRVNDVIYFNPADIDYPIAFNILETVDPSLKHIVASGLLGVFKKLWADSWGPRLEYVLRNAILALLDYPGSTLLGIMRMLTDKAYRLKVVEKIHDPVVKAFWVDEYARYPDKFQVEAIAPIQNKVGQFLSNFLIRNIVGQVKSTIDIRNMMDEGKILFLNLSKGRIGEDTSGLIGSMMITKIQLAAMSRVDTPEDQRRDFYLYVDEFQNFATESFANILSEARKYRLNLIIAHQYIEQLDERVKAAVFGNVGSIVCFRVGATDADELVKEFTPTFTEEDLINLTKWDIYLRLMIDGVASEPFSARGLPSFYKTIKPTENRDKVIRVSRERYAKSREIVEDKIVRWSGVKIGNEPAALDNVIQMKPKPKMPPKPFQPNSFQPQTPMNQTPSHPKPPLPEKQTPPASKTTLPADDVAPAATAPQAKLAADVEPASRNTAAEYLGYVARQQAEKGIKTEKEFVDRDPDGPTPVRKYPTQCWSCNKLTHVSFEPDGKRPVYCKNCLRDMRVKKAEERKLRPPMQKFPSSAVSEKPPVATIEKPQSEPAQSPQVKNNNETSLQKLLDGASPVQKLEPGKIVRFDQS